MKSIQNSGHLIKVKLVVAINKLILILIIQDCLLNLERIHQVQAPMISKATKELIFNLFIPIVILGKAHQRGWVIIKN